MELTIRTRARAAEGCPKALGLVALILILTPLGSWAEKLPGYEACKNGHEGYLGDGIIKAGEDPTADLARAASSSGEAVR